jgi:hypothetical protein
VTWVGAAASQPLTTAVYLDPEARDADAALAFARTRATGASVVRLVLYWRDVAPAVPPAGFDATNPDDPAYRWDDFDRQVTSAVRDGLQPLVTVLAAPDWAQAAPAAAPPSSNKPSPADFGDFATAAASRYNGELGGLPRVRYWQAWNEPNLSTYLRPQLVNGRPFAPGWYRKMLAAFAIGVRGAAAGNVVVAGGLAPFRDVTPEVQQVNSDWGPLSFMRSLLCLSKTLVATCSERTDLDVWAMHPYTSGGPTHHAQLADDVSLGDLTKVKRTLRAALASGHLSSKKPVQFWVTEFSWDSSPPDPLGVPSALLERWVPEALYRMWLNGVSLVTWFTLRDQPLATSFYQSGLYYRGSSLAADRPKPYLQGFRFPFVAFPEGPRVRVWGRTPAGRGGMVRIQQRSGRRWKTIARVRTDRNGIFLLKVTPGGVGDLRSVTARSASLPFSLRPVGDRSFNPFGQTGLGKP